MNNLDRMSDKNSFKNLANTEDSDDEEDQDYVPEEESDDEISDNIKNTKRKLNDQSENESPTKSKKDEIEPIKEEDKKKADELWANFLKDVKSKPAIDADYAQKYGKIIDIKKEPPLNKPKNDFFSSYEVKKNSPVHKTENRELTESGYKDQKKKPMGMSAILDKINNNEKLNTLVIIFDEKYLNFLSTNEFQEKSKIDWNEFKKEKKIEEDLANQVKGKNSYDFFIKIINLFRQDKIRF